MDKPPSGVEWTGQKPSLTYMEMGSIPEMALHSSGGKDAREMNYFLFCALVHPLIHYSLIYSTFTHWLSNLTLAL